MFSLESLYVSAIAEINSVIEEIMSKGISKDIAYYSWDARGQETELPNTDLIGLMGWTYNENEGLPVIQLGILTSLVLDQNQFREVRVMDILRNRFCGPDGDYKTLRLVTPDLGKEYGLLQVTDFEVMPAGRSEVRSTRNVAIELIRASGDQ